jgi:hypothetical protein
MTDTAITIPDSVLIQEPEQPKRLGELLTLAVKLLADLPAPRYVYVSRSCQEITLGFGSKPEDLEALTRWGSRYGGPIIGTHMTDSDGRDMVRCSLALPSPGGVTVEATAYIRAEQANS